MVTVKKPVTIPIQSAPKFASEDAFVLMVNSETKLENVFHPKTVPDNVATSKDGPNVITDAAIACFSLILISLVILLNNVNLHVYALMGTEEITQVNVFVKLNVLVTQR
jgi:hypothetical protein